MSKTPQQQQVLEGRLEPMFERAKADGLWFHHNGIAGDIWFSPEELREQHAKGLFIWGPVNWRLESPFEYLRELREKQVRATEAVKELKRRMASQGFVMD